MTQNFQELIRFSFFKVAHIWIPPNIGGIILLSLPQEIGLQQSLADSS